MIAEQMVDARFFKLLMKNDLDGRRCMEKKICVEPPRK